MKNWSEYVFSCVFYLLKLTWPLCTRVHRYSLQTHVHTPGKVHMYRFSYVCACNHYISNRKEILPVLYIDHVTGKCYFL